MATSSDARQQVPGPDHPITVVPTGRRVVGRVGDAVVVDTTSALTLQEARYPAVQYVPLAEIDPALLQPSQTHTYCPYKGEASYYALVVPGTGQVIPDAVWTYPAPYPAVVEIANHVAFYPNQVDVTVQS